MFLKLIRATTVCLLVISVYSYYAVFTNSKLTHNKFGENSVNQSKEMVKRYVKSSFTVHRVDKHGKEYDLEIRFNKPVKPVVFNESDPRIELSRGEWFEQKLPVWSRDLRFIKDDDLEEELVEDEDTPGLGPVKEWTYKTPIDGRRSNKSFVFSEKLLQNLDLPPSNFVELEGDFLKDFVFVTAASENHLAEFLDLLATLQQHFPGRKVLLYDLGLDPSQRGRMMPPGDFLHGGRVVCDVEYRTINTSLYRQHVFGNLKYYAWKFLLIQDALKTHPGVFWVDTSIRFYSSRLSVDKEKLLKNHGILLFSGTGHSDVAVTDPLMFEYIATDHARLGATQQWQAGGILVYNTRELYWNVMHWVYLCSMTRKCIVPRPRLAHGCNFSKHGYFGDFAGCHRYDQALVNLLLANYFDFTPSKYARHEAPEMLFNVQRGSRFHLAGEVKWCPLPTANPGNR